MDAAVIQRPRADRLGEGPLWSPRDQALYWVDILGKRLNRLRLEGGAVDEWALPEAIGWVIERAAAPGLIAGTAGGIKLLTLAPVAMEPFADLPGEPAANRMNDAKADSAGRIWAGTMPRAADTPTGNFYRLDADRTVTRVDTGYRVANGPAIAPDGTYLLHTDSVAREIYRFALHDDGSLGPRTPYLAFDPAWGKPDGMTFDAEGALWVACWGGSCVRRFVDARVERRIALPASQITSMAFAGDRHDRLFVTSAAEGVDEPLAGALFEIEPGVTGLAPHTYRG